MNGGRGIWRGKSSDIWVVGYLMKYAGGYQIWQKDEKYGSTDNYIVDEKTLGECTGLREMNGKPIFEGDICTVAMSNISDDEYGIVKFDENEAVFLIDFGTFTINFCNNVNGSAVEVIGNIHDNPELIQEGAVDNG